MIINCLFHSHIYVIFRRLLYIYKTLPISPLFRSPFLSLHSFIFKSTVRYLTFSLWHFWIRFPLQRCTVWETYTDINPSSRILKKEVHLHSYDVGFGVRECIVSVFFYVHIKLRQWKHFSRHRCTSTRNVFSYTHSAQRKP